MKINNNTQNFGSLSLSPLSSALYTLGNNDMLNASAIDIFAMDTPRTIVEFKNRGKQAGIEMAFREYTGTFIAEFSAILFALMTSAIFTKSYKPDTKVNPRSWVTNNAIETYSEIYNNSSKTLDGFIDKTLQSISGVSGNKTNYLKDFDTKNIKEQLIEIIKKPDKKASKNLQDNIITLIKADNNITLKSTTKSYSDNLTHIIRDIVDVSRNVFFKEGVEPKSAIQKLKKLNTSRIAAAIPLSMLLALTNQYINRQLTKKRVGIDNFVGENNYEQNIQGKKESKKEKGLFAKKILSAGIFSAMLFSVMGVKKPSDLVKKLEFNAAATGGNAIKTIYGSLIIGRIFASKDSTELRETNTRDYLGFLNWLVLGGFVSKGVAQIMDPKQKNLFNITQSGKGTKHWLKNVSLKSQKEIIAAGGNVTKNLKMLNIAQLAGIAYSAIMLGVLLPKLNIKITKSKKPKQNNDTSILITKNMPDTFKNFRGITNQ